jgi:acetylglutamate kinase
MKDLVLLWCLGLKPVLVHGGGPEINKWLSKMNIAPNFSPSGLRVTDAETMDVRATAARLSIRVVYLTSCSGPPAASCRAATLVDLPLLARARCKRRLWRWCWWGA